MSQPQPSTHPARSAPRQCACRRHCRPSPTRWPRGERDVAALVAVGRAVVDAEPLAAFEHLEIVHPDTLEPLTRRRAIDAVAVTAVWFGDVRLIDNRLL